MEGWLYRIRKDAFDIVEETERKTDANLKDIKSTAQKMVDFISDLEEHELREI